MSFTHVKELTATEALAALAYVEFKHGRFTDRELVMHLCTILSEPFKPGAVSAVDGILTKAERENLVEQAPGPRGGMGFKITATGVAFVSEVELPREKFRYWGNHRRHESGPPRPNMAPSSRVLPTMLARSRMGELAQP